MKYLTKFLAFQDCVCGSFLRVLLYLFVFLLKRTFVMTPTTHMSLKTNLLKVLTSHQRNLRLSFPAWKPKFGDKNHHSVLQSATGFDSPISPRLKRASFSNSVLSIAWAVLFVLWASDLNFAACTLRVYLNSLFFRMLNVFLFSGKYRSIARWKFRLCSWNKMEPQVAKAY